MEFTIGWCEKVEKWQCIICGYIYDPEVGDPSAHIDPGTPFENLPDDWVCPVCGAPKDQFAKVLDS
jgi:rubredoxin